MAFGAVKDGFDVLDAISNTFCVREKPLQPVTIVDCGILSDK